MVMVMVIVILLNYEFTSRNNITITHTQPALKTTRTTAADHEKTCESPKRYQKTLKKQKGPGGKNDSPKKQKLQKKPQTVLARPDR